MFVPGSGSDPAAARRRYSQDVGKGTTRPAGSTRTRVVSQGTAEAGATRNYILGDCLGKGASGSVYRALNWATGETVAIKRISLANIPRSDLSSIMSEIELLKGLRHPNIVKYKGFEKTQDFLFIVLEYCENGSLQSICKRFGRFPEGLVSVYINQVLEGLQFLHTQGVVHRDIKGANILTNKDGSVKLADFGVATKSGVISGNVVAGSPYWMAPEVIDQCGATSASDIWSVGCVVIELLEGRPPYHHLEPMPALFRIVQDDCPPLPGGASPMVLDFLKHCFEKDPTLRISAETLLEHPWMCSARRQLKHMNSTGSIGKDVHDQAVRTVRNHNRPSGRNGRPRPPPLRLDQAQPAQSDLLSPGLSTSRSLRRVAGSISPGPSAPYSPLRRSPLRLEQRAGSMGRDAESAALKATSVDVVLEEPKGTARSESCAAAPLEVHHGSRRRSMNVVRKVPLRRCTRHSTDESHAALTKVQPTDAHFSLESASLSASGDDEGQARESYRHGSPPTAPDTTMTVSKMRSPPPVADAVGQRSLHGSPQCCDSLPRTQLTSLGHSHALDGRQEAADSEIPGCSPNPPLIIFRSPFAVVGTDLAPDSPIRASPEYVRSKDLSKVRESVSLLKQRDASGRKVLQASDRIYEADGRPTKASGQVQHTDATQDTRIIRRANSAMLAEGVPRNLPATARTPVTIPTFTESPPSRQSRYASGVKRSASILSRTFSRSSSPSRSTPRADSAIRPGTDIAGDESIASFDRTSELSSSASREVIIRVLKGWR